VINDGVTGILCEPEDDQGIAIALCDLLANPRKRRELGAAAKARVEANFSVTRMAGEYHRDALNLIRARRAPGSRWRGWCRGPSGTPVMED
jgi:glycosyltransferase involved in cell wall biosynthesis